MSSSPERPPAREESALRFCAHCQSFPVNDGERRAIENGVIALAEGEEVRIHRLSRR